MKILSTTYDKPGRRTRDRVEMLDAQILQVLLSDQPQSIRHVFYRMTDPRLPEPVEKSNHGYRQVQHRTTQLRRQGQIPYDWITDATRRGYFTPTYRNGADFLRNHIIAYRADMWRSAEILVEVWAESRSIAGVVLSDCQELAVSLFPAGGFSSITFAYDAANNINCETGEGKIPVHIVYIGDYDPAGVLIDQSLERELREHLHPHVQLTFERLAITEEQIERYDLPTKPRKESDRRARHIDIAVEAEAMPAGILRGMLRERIESFLPQHQLEITRIVEQDERRGLAIWAELIDRYSPEAVQSALKKAR